MRYVRSRSSFKATQRPPGGGKSWMKWLVLAVVIVAIVTMIIGRGSDTEEDNVVDVAEIEEAVVADEMTAEELQVEEMIVTSDVTYEEITLVPSSTLGGNGFARRGIEEGKFVHIVVGTLPEINTETHFYEGWLVKPGVVEFFSTGEMFAREDGKWGLLYEVSLSDAPVDIDDYRRAVITLEPRDDDPAPAPDHIIEGEFQEELER